MTAHDPFKVVPNVRSGSLNCPTLGGSLPTLRAFLPDMGVRITCNLNAAAVGPEDLS